MKDKILTIDVGTGSTRAAIVRIDGAMIGFAQREYEQTTPRAGWSEQAPSLWWQAACDCIREVLYRYPETAAQIAVIGACGQMHGTVLLVWRPLCWARVCMNRGWRLIQPARRR